ncbi:kinase-like domain-containing protein [Pelagophyceae sp. CCMP2097]|nr:kinase-like domain-containing protein [Pelagophyceae sp. CCMP2097]
MSGLGAASAAAEARAVSPPRRPAQAAPGALTPDDEFDRLSCLGVGSFGKVLLCRRRRTDELFAVKLISLASLRLRKQLERMRTERDVCVLLEHEFIVKLHFAHRGPGACVALGFEYCAGGELFHHLAQRQALPAATVAFYGAQLALALQCAHDHGVAYRDVKPENCLLDHRGYLKLGDFGLAKRGVNEACRGAFSLCGTPEYMAPEVLSRHAAGYGHAVDWWGVGVWMYELLTGRPPWRGGDRAALFEQIRCAPLRLPPGMGAAAAAVVSALLRRHPRDRLCARCGASELRDLPLFRDHGVDLDAMVGSDAPAPIRPCAKTERPSNFANFDSKFTSLPTDVDGATDARDAPSFATIDFFEHHWDFARR